MCRSEGREHRQGAKCAAESPPPRDVRVLVSGLEARDGRGAAWIAIAVTALRGQLEARVRFCTSWDIRFCFRGRGVGGVGVVLDDSRESRGGRHEFVPGGLDKTLRA